VIELGTEELTAIAAVIAALVALVSATVGPFVAWKIAKRQITTTIRSTSRQKWLDTLRDEVAEFFGLLVEGGVARTGDTIPVSDIHDMANSLSRKLTKIELLLNPNEQRHQQLARLLREARSVTWNPEVPPDVEKIREKMDKAVVICQEILKIEWERTKEGE